MPWFNVDDGFAFHRKAIRAGNSAIGLWTRAGSWCAQQLTDGHVPDDIVAVLGTQTQADRLVAAGLWSRVPDGYQFHEWGEDGRNPTRESVLAKRRQDSDRKRQQRSVHMSNSVTPQVEDVCPTRTPSGVPTGVRGGLQSPTPLPSLKEEDSLRSSSRPRSQAKRGSTTRGTRIPDPFDVTHEMVEWAREHAPDVDGRTATAAFVDFWRGKPGSAGTKLDWPATWRNWMRKEQERLAERRARASPNGMSPTDAAIHNFASRHMSGPSLLALPGGAP